MKNVRSCAALICLCIICAGSSALMAQWQESGIPVCTESGNQTNTTIVSDGSGGAFVAWVDSRSGSYDIYAHKFDGYGNLIGPAGGVGVCIASGHQYSPSAVSDGAGGVILAWRDDRGAGADIYAQRLDSDLNPLWTADGVVVCNASGSQLEQTVVTDEEGGAIVVWRDQRSGSGDIYAQRIDPSGNMLWTSNGVPVCTESSYQYIPAAAADGAGGVIIAWEDYRSGNYDIYAQRLSGSGSNYWTFNGSAVCTEVSAQYDPLVAAGRSQDAIIVWQDWRGSSGDIYGQRISNGFPSWTGNGIGICTAANTQEQHQLMSDGEGGAFVCWSDSRNSSTTYNDIYAARVDIMGNISWTTEVCAANYNQYHPELVSDGENGIILTWSDYRFGNSDIYALRMDENGSKKWWWGINGVPLAEEKYLQYSPAITTDGSGGALVCWEDSRDGVYDVYAQRIERGGRWGYPAPSITSVRDVPGDQGGYVNLAWDASRLDPWPEEELNDYSIWRAISPVEAMLLAENGSAILQSTGDLAPGRAECSIRMQAIAGETYYWELVSTVIADNREHYSLVQETLFDSTGVCSEYYYFQVVAHFSSWCYYSRPDSGYSVDNLSPCAPQAFAGEQNYQPAGLQLTWDRNTELDMDNYNLYRESSETFLPGPANMVTAVCDTFYFDSEWRYDSGYWYKLAAVDVHGNESGYVVLAPEDVTGEEDPEMPLADFLAQNYPNPFNPATTIEFGLKEPADVSLVIYDAAGRAVRKLMDRAVPAGSYSVQWNGTDSSGSRAASGVYFYLITAGDFSERKKMVLLR